MAPDRHAPFLATLRRHAGVLAVCVVLQSALGVVAARAWLAQHNTLLANGRWASTKTELERGLMGAYAFVTERNALAGGMLNLGAWHGYNEVRYSDELAAPRRVELDFYLQR